MGADLANIVNEAAMTAVRAGRQQLTARDIYAGVDRFTQVRRVGVWACGGVCGVCGVCVWGGGGTLMLV